MPGLHICRPAGQPFACICPAAYGRCGDIDRLRSRFQDTDAACFRVRADRRRADNHEHYDHVGGLDDLRPFCRFSEIPVYSDAYTAAHLRARMPYCFVDKKYPGVPRIYLQEVEAGRPFSVRETEILPVTVMHGRLPILGYRIGRRLGYVTDMLTMPDASYEQLQGLDVLVINALRPQPHSTHQSIPEALAAAERIGARETYFIHMSHHAGLHAEIDRQLPPHVHFAYDGMEIDF